MKARLFARLREHFQRESQAKELVKEIEELTGQAAPGKETVK